MEGIVLSQIQPVVPNGEILKSRAYHEAGHAVACLVCGLPIVSVHISEVNGESGCLHYVGEDRYTRYQEMLVSMCGQAAETACSLLLSPNHPLSDGQDVSSVQDKLRKCLTEAQGDPFPSGPNIPEWINERLATLRSEASSLVETHKSSIEQLAVQLQQNNHRVGGEVYNMLSALLDDPQNPFANYHVPPRWYWDLFQDSRTDAEIAEEATHSFTQLAQEYQLAQEHQNDQQGGTD